MGRRRKKKREGEATGKHGERMWRWREPNGIWYVGWWDKRLGREVRRSLRTRDEDEATRLVAEMAAERRQAGCPLGNSRKPTVKRLFSSLRKFHCPDLSKYCRDQFDRIEELLTRFVGADYDLTRWSVREHGTFIRQRASGEMDARGRIVTDPEQRVPVSPATVGQDLAMLYTAINWGRKFRDENGRFLFNDNPMRGLEIPKEKNPNRPVATTDRVEAIRTKYQEVLMRVEWDGRREYRESFLPEVFDLVVETGRRIGAVCSLHTRDLRQDETEDEPYGAIVWPADTDKMGKEWRCPLTAKGRQAVGRALLKRPIVGAGWLFPAAKDKSKPVRIEQAESWLREAEKLAGVEHLDGTCFHAYRRLWATLRKDLPDVDVAQAGGWSSLAALKTAYQRPDAATIRRVVMHQAELRELR